MESHSIYASRMSAPPLNINCQCLLICNCWGTSEKWKEMAHHWGCAWWVLSEPFLCIFSSLCKSSGGGLDWAFKHINLFLEVIHSTVCLEVPPAAGQCWSECAACWLPAAPEPCHSNCTTVLFSQSKGEGWPSRLGHLRVATLQLCRRKCETFPHGMLLAPAPSVIASLPAIVSSCISPFSLQSTCGFSSSLPQTSYLFPAASYLCLRPPGWLS